MSGVWVMTHQNMDHELQDYDPAPTRPQPPSCTKQPRTIPVPCTLEYVSAPTAPDVENARKRKRNAWMGALAGLLIAPLVVVPAIVYMLPTANEPMWGYIAVAGVFFLLSSPYLCIVAWLVTFFSGWMAASSLLWSGQRRAFTTFLAIFGLVLSLSTSICMTVIAFWAYRKR
jgi:hypothetical protein